MVDNKSKTFLIRQILKKKILLMKINNIILVPKTYKYVVNIIRKVFFTELLLVFFSVLFFFQQKIKVTQRY